MKSLGEIVAVKFEPGPNVVALHMVQVSPV